MCEFVGVSTWCFDMASDLTPCVWTDYNSNEPAQEHSEQTDRGTQGEHIHLRNLQMIASPLCQSIACSLNMSRADQSLACWSRAVMNRTLSNLDEHYSPRMRLDRQEGGNMLCAYGCKGQRPTSTLCHLVTVVCRGDALHRPRCVKSTT